MQEKVFKVSTTSMTSNGAATGKEYEARLRQQHSKLNPRTSWATEALNGRKKRKHGFGDEDSEDDE